MERHLPVDTCQCRRSTQRGRYHVHVDMYKTVHKGEKSRCSRGVSPWIRYSRKATADLVPSAMGQEVEEGDHACPEGVL